MQSKHYIQIEVDVAGHLPPPKLLLPMSPTNISPLFPVKTKQDTEKEEHKDF